MRHVATAYLTYVAVDLQGKKMEVPQVVPETDHQKRRFDDAATRREMRSGETLRKKELRAAMGSVWNY
jgi:acyl-CoA hydrolase